MKIKRTEHLEICVIDEKGLIWSTDPEHPATIEAAREQIANNRKGNDNMTDENRAYWSNRRYAIRRIVVETETLEISEPPPLEIKRGLTFREGGTKYYVDSGEYNEEKAGYFCRMLGNSMSGRFFTEDEIRSGIR